MTGTPPSNTLPPTDAPGGGNTPSTEGVRIALVILAGLLATFLVLTPKRSSRPR